MDVAKVLRMTRKGTAMNATTSTRGNLKNGEAAERQKYTADETLLLNTHSLGSRAGHEISMFVSATVRVQSGYSQGTVRVQSGYSQAYSRA